MSLVATQAEFLLDACKLVQYATAAGFTVTGGELWRPIEMQQLYLKTGRSKTLNSQHLDRLAIDLNFFKNGRLVGTRDELMKLGEYWESLNPKNRWGGSWRGAVDAGKAKFVDAPHFERIT